MTARVATSAVSAETTPSTVETLTPEPVAVKLGLKASATSVRKGNSVTLSVNASDATGAVLTAKVLVERKTAHGWTRVAQVTLVDGKATTKIKPSTTTSYRVRVAKTDELSASTSKTLRVKVVVPTAPKPAHHHRSPAPPPPPPPTF